jgi:hypothetical protein
MAQQHLVDQGFLLIEASRSPINFIRSKNCAQLEIGQHLLSRLHALLQKVFPCVDYVNNSL